MDTIYTNLLNQISQIVNFDDVIYDYKTDKQVIIMGCGKNTTVFSIKTTKLTDYSSDVYQNWFGLLARDEIAKLMQEKHSLLINHKDDYSGKFKCIRCGNRNSFEFEGKIRICLSCITYFTSCIYQPTIHIPSKQNERMLNNCDFSKNTTVTSFGFMGTDSYFEKILPVGFNCFQTVSLEIYSKDKYFTHTIILYLPKFINYKTDLQFYSWSKYHNIIPDQRYARTGPHSLCVICNECIDVDSNIDVCYQCYDVICKVKSKQCIPAIITILYYFSDIPMDVRRFISTIFILCS